MKPRPLISARVSVWLAACLVGGLVALAFRTHTRDRARFAEARAELTERGLVPDGPPPRTGNMRDREGP